MLKKIRAKKLQAKDRIVRVLNSGAYVVERHVDDMKRRRKPKQQKVGDKHLTLVINERVRQFAREFSDPQQCPIATAIRQQVSGDLLNLGVRTYQVAIRGKSVWNDDLSKAWPDAIYYRFNNPKQGKGNYIIANVAQKNDVTIRLTRKPTGD